MKYKCDIENFTVIVEKRITGARKQRIAKRFEKGFLELDDVKDNLFIDKLNKLIKEKSKIIPGLAVVKESEKTSKNTKDKAKKKSKKANEQKVAK